MKTPIQAQVQEQSNEENQTKEQTGSKQKEGMYFPQTRQNTDKYIEQKPGDDTMPKYFIDHR